VIFLYPYCQSDHGCESDHGQAQRNTRRLLIGVA
jgi:hypothetical protein